MKDIDFGSIFIFSLVFILIFMVVRFAFDKFGLGCQGWDLWVDAVVASAILFWALEKNNK